ncbi:hypothetical protein LINPERHAP1_LOCUS9079, partial [Linum perenne]
WARSRLDAWKAKKKYAAKNNLPYEWVKQNPPAGCPETDWLAYMRHVDSQEFKDAVARNKANQACQEENHTRGSRPWGLYIEEEAEKTGQRPSRGQIFIKYYSWPNGEPKSAHAGSIMETIRQLEAAGVSTEWGPNDAFAQALNKPEHRGHVRMFGRDASKSQVFGTSVESSTSATGSISSR